MIGIKVEKNPNIAEKKIKESKINSAFVYSKIAPPNTFKRRNTNQQILKKPRILQRYDNTPQTNQLSSLYINNNNSNRASLKSKNNTLVLKPNTDIKISTKVNSSFIDKIKSVNGSLFNNNLIFSPKRIIVEKIKTKSNDNTSRLVENKNLLIKSHIYEIKKNNNSLYSKTNKINNMNKVIQKIELKNDKSNKNEKKAEKMEKVDKIDNLYIKNKYDFLLEKTRNLLCGYQKIVDYYQEKEKEKINYKEKQKYFAQK